MKRYRLEVPCWQKVNEPKCPANLHTAECYLWSRDSYIVHVPNHTKPAYCPLSGKTLTEAQP